MVPLPSQRPPSPPGALPALLLACRGRPRGLCSLSSAVGVGVVAGRVPRRAPSATRSTFEPVPLLVKVSPFRVSLRRPMTHPRTRLLFYLCATLWNPQGLESMNRAVAGGLRSTLATTSTSSTRLSRAAGSASFRPAFVPAASTTFARMASSTIRELLLLVSRDCQRLTVPDDP